MLYKGGKELVSLEVKSTLRELEKVQQVGPLVHTADQVQSPAPHRVPQAPPGAIPEQSQE